MAGREGGGHRSVQGRALAVHPRDGGRANGSVLDASEPKVRGWNDHGEQGRKEQRVGSGILCVLGLEKGSLRTGI